MIAEKFNTGEKIIRSTNFPKPAAVNFTNGVAAASLFEGAIANAKHNNKIILVHADVDFDGIAAAYIMHWAASNSIGRYNVNVCINIKRVHGVSENLIDMVNKANGSIELLVIVDSSSSMLSTIKKANCDVLVIDHHELTIKPEETVGETAGGRYVIVNNRLDDIKDMSGAQVVYEWLRASGYEAALEAEKLYSWVAVSLFSDVIDCDNERNQWYVQQLVDKRRVEQNLEALFRSAYRQCTFSKSDISFSLVPLINAAIRLKRSTAVLDYVLNKPERIWELSPLRDYQADLVDKALSAEVREARAITYEDFMLYDISDIKGLEGFEGLIATKLQDECKKTCIVYRWDDEENGIKGSFRACGVMSAFKLREELHAMNGMTAEGHDEAFGFTCKGGDSAVGVLTATLTALIEKYRAEIAAARNKNEAFTVQVDTKEQMDELIRTFEISAMATINAHMSSTKKALIKVPNIPQNVKILTKTGKTIEMNVLGLSVTAFEVPKTNFGYIYLYPESSKFLTVYVDGVRQ